MRRIPAKAVQLDRSLFSIVVLPVAADLAAT
jgi:hypothetical protein